MKRLVICCDGTWKKSDFHGPSNVTQIAQAIQPLAFDGAQQVVFYHSARGVDTQPGTVGAELPGSDIDRDIQDAYRFLVHNYRVGDELWFFGFSRGAYLVRSLIGLIRNAGLLHKQHGARVADAYHIYRTHWGPDASNATKFREACCTSVKLHFLGVWDTVGKLGVPAELFAGDSARRYRFHDNCLSQQVENAYHALAIDERRQSLAASLWQTRPGQNRTEQCWFSGVHADVGGSYPDAGLSHITLRWMAGKAAACGLDLNQNYLNQVYAHRHEEVLHDSSRTDARQWQSQRRVIGQFNQDETLHPSAEQRYLRDRRYRPANLKAYLQQDEQIRLPL